MTTRSTVTSIGVGTVAVDRNGNSTYETTTVSFYS
jgi:hypothetical protein